MAEVWRSEKANGTARGLSFSLYPDVDWTSGEGTCDEFAHMFKLENIIFFYVDPFRICGHCEFVDPNALSLFSRSWQEGEVRILLRQLLLRCFQLERLAVWPTWSHSPWTQPKSGCRWGSPGEHILPAMLTYLLYVKRFSNIVNLTSLYDNFTAAEHWCRNELNLLSNIAWNMTL